MRTGKYMIAAMALVLSVDASRAAWEYVRVNTTTGELQPSGVGGLTWNGAAIATSPGETAISTYYNPLPTVRDNGWDHRGFWSSGTLHVLAFNNARMQGMSLVNETFEVDDIRGLNQFVITNTELLEGDTYWYAWFDVDADGELNKLGSPSYGTPEYLDHFIEPAALGEHMPLTMTDYETSAESVDFWLVEMKGLQPRFIMHTDQVEEYAFMARNISEVGSPIIEKFTNFAQCAWIESATHIQDKGSDQNAGSQTVGGVYDYGYGDADTQSPPVFTCEILINSVSLDTFNYGVGNDGTDDSTFTVEPTATDDPVCAYPISGATVDSATIEFRVSNAWHYYSAIEFEIRDTTTGGALIYDYEGYMENEHYDDQQTRHKATLTGLTDGNTYHWRVRCVSAFSGSVVYPRTDWSAWETFVYDVP